jgi:hypothetical protein
MKFFEVLMLCNLYFSQTYIELVARTFGIDNLLKFMTDDVVTSQREFLPHQFL